MLPERSLMLVATILLVFEISFGNSLKYLGLNGMPDDLKKYVEDTLAYSPEISANPDIAAALAEGRMIVQSEYAVEKPEDKSNQSCLHLVVCELITKPATSLSKVERERACTMTEGDLLSFMQAENPANRPEQPDTSSKTSPVADDAGEGTENDQLSRQKSETNPNSISTADSSRETPFEAHEIEQPVLPIMSQETHVICLYFHEYGVVNLERTYTMIHIGAKVMGPIRRAVADLFVQMEENKFKADLLEAARFRGNKDWSDAQKEFIEARRVDYFKASEAKPILYTFAGNTMSGRIEHVVVYEVTRNSEVEYVAAAYRISTDKSLPSMELKSSIQRQAAKKRADIMLDCEWKAVNPTLRVTAKYLKKDSRSSSGPSTNTLSTSQTIVAKLSNLSTSKWDLVATRQQILSYAVVSDYLTEAERAKAEVSILVTLRPKEEPEHMSNSEPVAFVLCRREHTKGTDFFVSVMNNVDKVPSIRMFLNFCSTISAALITAETFFKQYLFWATQNSSKLSRYAEILKQSTIEATLRERLALASQALSNIPGLMENGKKVGEPTWDCKLVAATDFLYDGRDNFDVFVIELQNMGKRPVYTAVVRKSAISVAKKSGGWFSKKLGNNSSTSSTRGSAENNSPDKHNFGISPLYFSPEDLLNRPISEFKEIYDQRRTDIVVACDLRDTEWWNSISERIRDEVNEELELLPYPMLSLDSMRVTFRYALYPALLYKETEFGVPAEPQKYAASTPTYVLCEVQCGFGLGYLQYFAVVLEEPGKFSLRLITNYTSTGQGSVKDVVRFVDDYLYWDNPGAGYLSTLSSILSSEIGTQLNKGIAKAAAVEKKLKESSWIVSSTKMLRSSRQGDSKTADIRIADTDPASAPADSATADPAVLQEVNHLDDISKWCPVQKATFKSENKKVEVLVLKPNDEGPLALIVLNMKTGRARLSTFFNNFSSIRNKTTHECDRELQGGVSEYSMYWGNKLMYTNKWKTYFYTYGTREVESELQMIMVSKMKRALPPTSMVPTAYALKGTLQGSQADDFYFMYTVTWLPTTNQGTSAVAKTMENPKTHICLVQMRSVGYAGTFLTVREKPQFFKSESEARDYALLHDSLSD